MDPEGTYFVRLCDSSGCDADPDVLYKGVWCAFHAYWMWGSQPGTVARIRLHPPQGKPQAGGEGSAPPGDSRPRGRASTTASVGVSESAPILSEEELFRILEVDGWSEFRALTLEEVDDRIYLYETAQQMREDA